MQLQLAVDAHDLARDHRGLGRYARAVLRELVNDPSVSLTLLTRSFLTGRAHRAFARALGSANFRVARSVPKKCDVVWHPWNRLDFQSRAPQVVTIADVAPFRFPVEDEARRQHQQQPFLDAAARAARIITISQSSARDIQQYLGIPKERICVTYLGVEPNFQPGKFAVMDDLHERGYFLFIGDPQEERKNFNTLFEAWRQAFPNAEIALAVLSEKPPPTPALHLPTDREDREGTGNARLRNLYRGAVATCVPALYEGFGMPALESMACGTPVIAADASSLPEVCGNSAVYVSPANTEAWKETLLRIHEDAATRSSLATAGIARASTFTWRRCAQETLQVLHEAANAARN